TRCIILEPNALLHCAIRDVQCAVDDREALAELVLVDAKRWIREERVPPNERVKAFAAEEPGQFPHLCRRSAKWRERFPRSLVANQLANSEQAYGADRTD